MLRRLILFSILVPLLAPAAVWPDVFAGVPRASTRPVAVTDKAVWEEYGFTEGEAAQYGSGPLRFTAAAYRFNDPTGALSAFEWRRPAGAGPSALGQHAAETSDSVWLVFGNYLLQFEGRKPAVKELAPLLEKLPLLDQSSFPAFIGYLPDGGLLPNSQRLILGPVSLAKFEPRIPPSVAAFHFGTEAQYARYRSGSGDIGFVLFSFPTPQIARERVEEFRKLAGAMVKRSGPLVAVVLSPPDPNEAERILSRVRYHAAISWSEYVPSRRDNIGDLIVTAFVLVGLLLAFAVVAGLAFGGIRLLARFWLGAERVDDPMITLHLGDR